MRIEDTFIEGLKIIHLDKFTDARGSFLKVFNEDFFKANKLETDYKESYYTISGKNVVRGMHFQIPPLAHVKLVYLSNGKILDVILDIRKQSATFGKFFNIELTPENPVLIYIPIGFAHGFLSLKENSMVSYLQTSVYNAISDSGILWNSFGFDWPVTNPILSKRDMSFSQFSQFNNPFA